MFILHNGVAFCALHTPSHMKRNNIYCSRLLIYYVTENTIYMLTASKFRSMFLK